MEYEPRETAAPQTSEIQGWHGRVGSSVGWVKRPRYRILEKQGHLMVARTRKKLDSFAIDFAFQGF